MLLHASWSTVLLWMEGGTRYNMVLHDGVTDTCYMTVFLPDATAPLPPGALIYWRVVPEGAETSVEAYMTVLLLCMHGGVTVIHA